MTPKDAPAAGKPGAPGAGRVHALIDRLTAEYAGDAHRTEVEAAHDSFFERAGKVFEDDEDLFDGRTAAFLEWYVIERPLDGGRRPVIDALDRTDRYSLADRQGLAFLAASVRSLFQVAQVRGDVVWLDDLLGGAHLRVVERRSTVGFESGDILEARLCWDGTSAVFGKTFLFHPRDARDDILATVPEAWARGARRDDILFGLSRLCVQWHRLGFAGHTGADRIYRGGLAGLATTAS